MNTSPAVRLLGPPEKLVDNDTASTPGPRIRVRRFRGLDLDRSTSNSPSRAPRQTPGEAFEASSHRQRIETFASTEMEPVRFRSSHREIAKRKIDELEFERLAETSSQNFDAETQKALEVSIAELLNAELSAEQKLSLLQQLIMIFASVFITIPSEEERVEMARAAAREKRMKLKL